MTRFNCMVGSSAGQRAAVAQALHHCSIRAAFGKVLNRQPLMLNVLADLVLEAASLALSMRVARALDHRDDEQEDLLVRLLTAVGKYWICKRTPNHAYEAMECIGGSGVMEDGPMPRLLRESPVNAIWEGSGNIQCLDVLRAIARRAQRVLRRGREVEGNERAARPFRRRAARRTRRYERTGVPRPNARRPDGAGDPGVAARATRAGRGRRRVLRVAAGRWRSPQLRHPTTWCRLRGVASDASRLIARRDRRPIAAAPQERLPARAYLST